MEKSLTGLQRWSYIFQELQPNKKKFLPLPWGGGEILSKFSYFCSPMKKFLLVERRQEKSFVVLEISAPHRAQISILPVGISFNQLSETKGGPFGSSLQPSLPASLLTFFGKPAANGYHQIAGSQATSCKCKQVAKHLARDRMEMDCNHMRAAWCFTMVRSVLQGHKATLLRSL